MNEKINPWTVDEQVGDEPSEPEWERYAMKDGPNAEIYRIRVNRGWLYRCEKSLVFVPDGCPHY